MGFIYLSNLNMTPFYLNSSYGSSSSRPGVMEIIKIFFQRETLNYLSVKL
jgi:hypothetical protein